MIPRMLVADSLGNIYDHPTLLMLCRHGNQWGTPRPSELIPLPKESELFLLPRRKAVGLNAETGEIEVSEDIAVAAFLAPAHTISAHPCYVSEKDAPTLPLFAYGAVGFLNDEFYVCAKRVDASDRQRFAQVSRKKIAQNSRELLLTYPKNRLISHILNNCVARYDCPAARNFALGRFEAPLPTSRTCNARCLGCISKQEKNSPIERTPQCRLQFTPSPEEIVQVMSIHAKREKNEPVFSFGQGCEGDPLMNADLLAESTALYRRQKGEGTINCNTNASNPDAIVRLAQCGLTSIRVSLNSCQEILYNRYYRPENYSFSDVKASISCARKANLFVSLNLLYFPGLTDTEEELEALGDVCEKRGVSMIQWRNLNIDPEWYLKNMTDFELSTSMGLEHFMQRLKKRCPWLLYGYFNPYLGTRAKLTAPMACEE